MSDWPILRTVIGREYKAWKKPFLISSAIILALVGAGLTIANVVGRTASPPEHEIAAVGATPPGFAAAVGELLPEDVRLEVVRFESATAAEEAARDGDVTLVVVDDDTVIWGSGVTDALGDGVVQTLLLAQARRRAAELGITASDTDRLLTPQLEFRQADPQPEDASGGDDEGVAVFATIIMFMAIISYGQWIGYAVVEEKANRVVELLLGAVRPHQLMGAKVVSIGSLGLAQIAAVGVLVFGFAVATDSVGVPTVRLSTVFWVLLWFFLGYAFYGSLYAAAGSLASNSQEAGATIGPLAIFLVVGYITGLIAFGESYDTVWLQIMSFIPLWSPLVMPGRIIRGWALPSEVALSLVIMVAAIYGMVRLAGWIYTGGVARATQKLGWREALHSGRDLRARE